MRSALGYIVIDILFVKTNKTEQNYLEFKAIPGYLARPLSQKGKKNQEWACSYVVAFVAVGHKICINF